MVVQDQALHAGELSDSPPIIVADEPCPARRDALLRRQQLRSLELSTATLPREDQFALWRDNFAPMLSLSEGGEAQRGFDGRQVIWDLGSLAFSRISTRALHFTSLPGHVRREPLDHWMMTLLLDGRSSTAGPGRTLDCGAGVVQLHPLGRPFEGDVSDSEMLMLIVPRDFCRDAVGTLDAAEFCALDTGLGRLFADFLIGLANCLPTLSVDELPALAAAMRAMIVACVAPTADNLAAAQDPLGAVLLERARRFVAAHLYEGDLGAETLRRALGISRTRLYRLFEPNGGVMSYIQHRRLLDAHAALADQSDGRRILDIAEERGFSDAADFSRAFKRKFGYSPSEVRARRMGEGAVRPHPEIEAEAPSRRWGALLRRLQA